MHSTFDNTVAARWLRDLVGRGRPGPRSHWRTKTAYYRAVAGLLADGPGRSLRWSTIVDAVPGGSRSTFYDVTGRNASHSLMGRYATATGLDAIQIVLCYQRSSAVEQLVDETKVWSYWPFRTRWLANCRADPGHGELAIAASLESAVAAWAQVHPGLAAAVDHAPPACAVEDLALVRQGNLPAIRAWSALTHVVAGAVAAVAGTGPLAVDPRSFRRDAIPWQRGARGVPGGGGLRGVAGATSSSPRTVAQRPQGLEVENREPAVARADEAVPA